MEGLKWIPYTNNTYIRYQKQLNFSRADHVVDFKNAGNDYVNARTETLPTTGKVSVNVYCGYKGDEMWIGLIECSDFRPDHYYRCKPRTLSYYGGRGRNRPAANAKCPEYWGKCDGSDCSAGGSIQGGTKRVIVHPIAAYVAGDWITFKIDFDAKTLEFYHNGQFVWKVESDAFPNEQCYFVGQVDTRKDWLFIEQSHVTVWRDVRVKI